MKAIFQYLVERGLLVNLVSLFLVAIGVYAMFAINREAFPNVNLDLIQINTNYPGATPDEVERLVVTPIEQEIKSLSGIDRMVSTSFPGSGRIVLELDPYATNRDRLVSDTQLAVDRADLPRDLPEEPQVLELEGAVFPVIQLAVSAPRSPLQLKRLGDRIRDDLLELKGVAKVVIQGERKAEIRVVAEPEKLRQQRLSIGEIATALTNWNISAPGGDLDTPAGQKAVRIVGEFRDAEDAANLVIRANELGGGLRLKEVARVTETLEEPTVIYDVGEKPALAMLVLKKADADIITVVGEIERYLETISDRYGPEVRVDTFQDFSRFARLRLGVLTNNGLVGIVLVFITLILFLRPSVALTTTWGLPIVFFTGLFVLHISGITLNLVSMMGFIIVLGMLVDDAIIIGENITYHMEKGMTPVKAAVQGAYELIGPVTTTITTTIAAFLPLMFMSGIIGKFIVAIPVVVISLLIFSWLEAFLMLPSHVAHVTNPHKHPAERAWLVALEDAYGRLLERAVRYRWITLGLSLAVLVGSLALAKTTMSFQLFPSVAVDQYIVRMTASPGTSLETLREQLKQVDGAVRSRVKPEHLETTLITSGEVAIDTNDPLTQRGGRFGQIRVIYTPAVLRPGHDALDDMRELSKLLPPMFPELSFALAEIRPGPPTGRPLEAEISSYDPAISESAARRLMALLQKQPGVTAVESGLQRGDEELRVVLDRALATYAGVDLATAANHVRAAVGGLRVSTTRRGTEEIDITIRYPENGANELQQLQGLLIPNQRGGLVPLAKIARLGEHTGFTTIRHKAGIRVVNVVADVDANIITSREINRLVAEKEPEWMAEDASKLQVNYGGEAEKNEQSFRDLGVSFIFALVGIFFILAIQFNNLSYPLIVMLAIPFGTVGIVLSFFLHDLLWKPMPLSFFSTLGMVALSGVVVNGSLVLLVFIQRAVRAGTALFEAIVQAGRRRLRAVVLTAATTVVGLLPTAYGWGGLDPFVAPMALALSWGLIFATLITLVTIPATLAAGHDVKTVLRRLRRGRPSRDAARK